MYWKHVIAVTLISLGYNPTASAQRLIHGVVGAGATIPVGNLSDSYSTGSNVLVGLVIGAQESFYGLRVEYSSNQLNGRKVMGENSVEKKYRSTTVPAVTVNAIVTMPDGQVKPYIMAGAGWYQYREVADTHRDNDFGVNGGFGLAFPLMSQTGFIEARYHNVLGRSTSNYFVPVTFGIFF